MKSQKVIVCNKKICRSIRSQRVTERYRNRHKAKNVKNDMPITNLKKNNKKAIPNQRKIINSHIKLKLSEVNKPNNSKTYKTKNYREITTKNNNLNRYKVQNKVNRYKLPQRTSTAYKTSLKNSKPIEKNQNKPIIKIKGVKYRETTIKVINKLDASKREVGHLKKRQANKDYKYKLSSLNVHTPELSKLEKQAIITPNSMKDKIVDNNNTIFTYYRNKKKLSEIQKMRSLIYRTDVQKEILVSNDKHMPQTKTIIAKNYEDYNNYINRVKNKNGDNLKKSLDNENYINMVTVLRHNFNANKENKLPNVLKISTTILTNDKIKVNNFIKSNDKTLNITGNKVIKAVITSDIKEQPKIHNQIVKDELQRDIFNSSKRDVSFEKREKINSSSSYQRFSKNQETDNKKTVKKERPNTSKLDKQKSEFRKKIKPSTKLQKFNKRLNNLNGSKKDKEAEQYKNEMLEVGTFGIKLITNPKALKSVARFSKGSINTAKTISKTTKIAAIGIKKLVTAVVGSKVGILIILILVPLLILSSLISSSASTYPINFVMCTDEFKQSVEEKVTELNNDASDRLDSLVASAVDSYDEVNLSPANASISIDYRYFLCILAVMNEQAFDDDSINELSSIHNLFYEIKTKSSTFIVYEEHDRDDETVTIAVTKTRLDITVIISSYLEVVDRLGFTDDQIEWLNILISNEMGEDAIGGTGTGYTNLSAEELDELYELISKISDPKRREIIEAGLSLYGYTGYLWGGKAPAGGKPSGLDCSGFVDWCYKTSIGYEGLRGGGTAYQFGVGDSISLSEIKPGDLGFWKLPSQVSNTSNDANHVGIYVGTLENGRHVYIHSQGGTGVTISSFSFMYHKTISDVNLTFYQSGYEVIA